MSLRELHWIARDLQNPFPTLHKFSITVHFGVGALELPPCPEDDRFPHVKKLHDRGYPAFGYNRKAASVGAG